MIARSAPKASCLSILMGYFVLWLAVAGTFAGLGAAGAAVMVGVAPNFTARLVGPLFCPAEATPNIKTIYGATYRDSDNITSQQQRRVINCTDAQGAPVEGTGDRFELIWYGGWIAASVLLGTLVSLAWIVLSSLIRARGTAASRARAGLIGAQPL